MRLGRQRFVELSELPVPAPELTLDGAVLDGPRRRRYPVPTVMRLGGLLLIAGLLDASIYMMSVLAGVFYKPDLAAVLVLASGVLVLFLTVPIVATYVLLALVTLPLGLVLERRWPSRDVVLEGHTVRTADGSFSLTGEWTHTLTYAPRGAVLRLTGPGRTLELRGDHQELAWLDRHLTTLQHDDTEAEAVPEALHRLREPEH